MITTKEKIKALRSHGLTLSEIALRTGIPQPTISRIASGSHGAPREINVLKVHQLYVQVVERKRIKKSP